MSFVIPIRGSVSNESVVLTQKNFSDDPADVILSVLESEYAPLETWLKVAYECYRLKRVDAYLSVLESANSDDLEDEAEYRTQRGARVKVCTSLAAYHIARALKSVEFQDSGFHQAEALLRKAELLARKSATTSSTYDKNHGDNTGIDGTRFLFKETENALQGLKDKFSVDAVDADLISVWTSKGFWYLAQHTVTSEDPEKTQKLSKAAQVFSHVSKEQPNNPYAKLGQAAVQMRMRNYKQALLLYADVLVSYPRNCPANVRFGIGLCLYHLGQYARAQRAFNRTLELEPNNVDALCALGNLQPNTPNGVKNRLSLIRRAASINPTNSNVLLIMADSAFYCEKYTEASHLLQFLSQSNSSPQVQALNRYQQGRCHHCYAEFPQAYVDYSACLKTLPTHTAARFGFIQCAIQLDKFDEAIQHLQVLKLCLPNHYDVLRVAAFSLSLLADAIYSTVNKQSQSSQLEHTCCGTFIDQILPTCEGKTLADADKFRATALEYLKQILEMDPSDREAHLVNLRVCETEWQRGNLRFCKAALNTYMSLLGNLRNESKSEITTNPITTPTVTSAAAPVSLQTNITGNYENGDKVARETKEALATKEANDIAFSENHSADLAAKTDASSATQSPLHAEISSLVSGDLVPYQLANNFGVFHLIATSEESKRASLAAFEAAKRKVDSELAKLALQPSVSAESEARLKCAKITIAFNTALQAELTAVWSVAHEGYKTLNLEHPSFADAWIRKAIMSIERHDLRNARKYCEGALKHSPGNREASFVLCEVFRLTGRFEKAISVVSKIVKATEGHEDTYACTLYACLLYQKGLASDRLSSDTIRRCGKYFIAALKADPSNWVASNGIGVLFAEKNFVGPASEIYRMILESASSTLPSPSHFYMESVVNMNAGILHSIAVANSADSEAKTDGQMINKASKHFQNALKRAPMNKDLHLLMSRLCFDANKFRECQQLLEEASIKWPEDLRFRHNLALAIENAIYKEMRIDAFVKDPAKVRMWISECQMIGRIHQTNLSYKNTWPELANVDKNTICRVRNGVEPVKALRGPLCVSNFATVPPQNLEDLPSKEKLTALYERTAKTMFGKLTEVLPMVVRSWEKKQAELENIRLKNEELRRHHEALLSDRQKMVQQEENRKRHVADCLRVEAERLAGEIQIKMSDTTKSSGRQGSGKKSATDFINDDDEYDYNGHARKGRERESGNEGKAVAGGARDLANGNFEDGEGRHRSKKKKKRRKNRSGSESEGRKERRRKHKHKKSKRESTKHEEREKHGEKDGYAIQSDDNMGWREDKKEGEDLQDKTSRKEHKRKRHRHKRTSSHKRRKIGENGDFVGKDDDASMREKGHKEKHSESKKRRHKDKEHKRHKKGRRKLSDALDSQTDAAGATENTEGHYSEPLEVKPHFLVNNYKVAPHGIEDVPTEEAGHLTSADDNAGGEITDDVDVDEFCKEEFD